MGGPPPRGAATVPDPVRPARLGGQTPLFKGATPTVYSTPLAARLQAGNYRLEMTDFYNMSYLESNRTFTGAGGAEPANRFDIHGVRLLRVK